MSTANQGRSFGDGSVCRPPTVDGASCLLPEPPEPRICRMAVCTYQAEALLGGFPVLPRSDTCGVPVLAPNANAERIASASSQLVRSCEKWNQVLQDHR